MRTNSTEKYSDWSAINGPSGFTSVSADDKRDAIRTAKAYRWRYVEHFEGVLDNATGAVGLLRRRVYTVSGKMVKEELGDGVPPDLVDDGKPFRQLSPEETAELFRKCDAPE